MSDFHLQRKVYMPTYYKTSSWKKGKKQKKASELICSSLLSCSKLIVCMKLIKLIQENHQSCFKLKTMGPQMKSMWEYKEQDFQVYISNLLLYLLLCSFSFHYACKDHKLAVFSIYALTLVYLDPLSCWYQCKSWQCMPVYSSLHSLRSSKN